MSDTTELAAYALRFEPTGLHKLIRIGTAQPLVGRPGWAVDLDALPPCGHLILAEPNQTKIDGMDLPF